MTNHRLTCIRGFFLKFERKSAQTSNKQGMKYQAEICLGQHCLESYYFRFLKGELSALLFFASVLPKKSLKIDN